MEKLTAEEARTVELSRRPLKRLGQLAEYGAAFGLRNTGWSPLPLYLTRGDLVRVAEAHERAEQMVEALSTPVDAQIIEQQGEEFNG